MSDTTLPSSIEANRILSLLKEIHAPTVVGTPPANAYRDMVQLPDGEIRHYGFHKTDEHEKGVYVASRDHGLSWQEFPLQIGCPGACVRSPWSGDWLTVIEAGDEFVAASGLIKAFPQAEKGLWLFRSSGGIDGPFTATCVTESQHAVVRQPIALGSRPRWVFACQAKDEQGRYHPVVHLSDDDGRTWRRRMLDTVAPHQVAWPHEGVRWQNYGNEPSIVELSDGRIWMLMRTSQDQHYQSFSSDAGDTWSTPEPSRFYATLTMPTLFRMKDGRILCFWCNNTPLPELDHDLQPELQDWERAGHAEDVFTNRDVFHAAISEDDGKHWIGFREIRLSEIRNDSDFRSKGGNAETLDKSMHQSQAVELPGGKILVAHGQHPLCRRFVIFDPAWLYESVRRDDFRLGLGDWSTYQYVKGIVGNFRGITGHCAYNRRPGAQLIPDPDGEPREVLQIARHPDPRLVHERQGAVWNFPAGQSGRIQIRFRLMPESQGVQFCLLDRWFNPVDPAVAHFAQHVLKIDTAGKVNETDCVVTLNSWHNLVIEWSNARSSTATWQLNEIKAKPIPLTFPSVNGISYLHIQNSSDTADVQGTLICEVLVRTANHAPVNPIEIQ